MPSNRKDAATNTSLIGQSEWAFGDLWAVAYVAPQSWSGTSSIKVTIDQLSELSGEDDVRPVVVRILPGMNNELHFGNARAAINYMLGKTQQCCLCGNGLVSWSRSGTCSKCRGNIFNKTTSPEKCYSQDSADNCTKRCGLKFPARDVFGSSSVDAKHAWFHKMTCDDDIFVSQILQTSYIPHAKAVKNESPLNSFMQMDGDVPDKVVVRLPRGGNRTVQLIRQNESINGQGCFPNLNCKFFGNNE